MCLYLEGLNKGAYCARELRADGTDCAPVCGELSGDRLNVRRGGHAVIDC